MVSPGRLRRPQRSAAATTRRLTSASEVPMTHSEARETGSVAGSRPAASHSLTMKARRLRHSSRSAA